MAKKTPEQLVRYFGSQTLAAESLGYTKAAVSLWVKNGKLPGHVQNHFASHQAAWAVVRKVARKVRKKK